MWSSLEKFQKKLFNCWITYLLPFLTFQTHPSTMNPTCFFHTGLPRFCSSPSSTFCSSSWSSSGEKTNSNRILHSHKALTSSSTRSIFEYSSRLHFSFFPLFFLCYFHVFVCSDFLDDELCPFQAKRNYIIFLWG